MAGGALAVCPRTPHTELCFPPISLPIVLPDTNRYSEAEELLQMVLESTSTKWCESLRCPTALRLSKVLRRCDKLQFPAEQVKSPIRYAIDSLHNATKHAKAECIDELSSTIFQLQSAGKVLRHGSLNALMIQLKDQTVFSPTEMVRFRNIKTLVEGEARYDPNSLPVSESLNNILPPGGIIKDDGHQRHSMVIHYLEIM